MTHALVLTDDAAIAEVARSARRVAVLGIKTDDKPREPGFYVPKYLHEAGLTILPVPVYYPEVTSILGQPVWRKVADVPQPIDVVCVFRRKTDLMAHVDDLLAAHPTTVWLQTGIRNDDFAAAIAQGGIQVVQDRCLMIEHKKALGRG